MQKIYKYNYFYKITNNINGHYYYGIHSTNNIDDGYMGSGTILHQAFEKYGINNFTKDIIKFFDNREDCSKYEQQIVTKEIARDRNCYNVRLGGDNQHIWFHKDYSREHLRIKMTPQNSTNTRVWVCKDGKVKYLKKEYLEEYLLDGWELGRKDYNPRKGYNGVLIGAERKIKEKIKKKSVKRKIKERNQKTIKIKEERDKIRNEKIQLILNSDVDFSKFGWVGKIAKLINIPPQKVNIFMKKYMSDFYQNCFKRKTID